MFELPELAFLIEGWIDEEGYAHEDFFAGLEGVFDEAEAFLFIEIDGGGMGSDVKARNTGNRNAIMIDGTIENLFDLTEFDGDIGFDGMEIPRDTLGCIGIEVNVEISSSDRRCCC